MNVVKIICLCLLSLRLIAAQTGGSYDLSHNVIASGGGSNSIGGNFKVDGTVGQNIAGTVSTNGNFSLRGGFWSFQQLAPTAATVSLSGRVNNNEAGVIRRVRIVLTDASTGLVRSTQTNSFGYYRFEELEAGRFYVVRAVSNNFTFTPENYALTLLEDRDGVDFTGERIQF